MFIDVLVQILKLTYSTELMYMFIDISVLVTTCCYVSVMIMMSFSISVQKYVNYNILFQLGYSSGRMFLIITWIFAFLPILGKIYACLMSRSKRFCILEFGMNGLRGQTGILTMNLLPLLVLRFYELLVLTSYISTILELGNLEHETKIQGMTLREYLRKHDEYLRMDRNRFASTTTDEDAENA